MPNTKVRLGPAFVGAVFGGVLWAAVGALFARIVIYSAKTAAIYAGFAVVLLFLLWLYLSWLIVLLGAQLSFYVQHPEHLRTGHGEIPMTGGLRERIAMSAMFLVGERFLDGGPRWSSSDLADRMDVPATVLGEVISALEAHGLVLTAEDDTITPARDLAQIPLAAILDAIRHELPDPRRPEPRAVPAADAVTPAGRRRRCAQRCRARRCATWCGRRAERARLLAGDGHLLDQDRARADAAAHVDVGADVDDASVHVLEVARRSVTSCTGYASLPFSTQKPAAPRE